MTHHYAMIAAIFVTLCGVSQGQDNTAEKINLQQRSSFVETTTLSSEYQQRTTSVSKASCPTAAQARIKAEKANPGWRVVNIKEMSKVWHITLKK